MNTLSQKIDIDENMLFTSGQKISTKDEFKMKKIVVYDFDKTLTREDTLLGFFRHSAKNESFYFIKLPLYLFCMVLAKIKFIDNTALKKIGVRLFLYGMSKEFLEQKARSYKDKIVFNDLYHDLEYKKDIQYFIISASFEEYIKPIFPDFVTVIGSKLDYERDIVKGLSFNCYKDVKKEALRKLGIEKIALLFTDSYSDLALATISDKTIVVNREKLIECDSVELFKRVVKNENFNI